MQRMRRIYLDTAAATPLDKRVVKAMQPWWQKQFGNPSSIHAEGEVARKALEQSRKNLANFLSAHPDEIIFTSGGTEGNNLVLNGVVAMSPRKDKHIIVSAIEHSSILATVKALERWGVAVTVLPVSSGGLVEAKTLADALRPETVLVSIGYVNNELGAIQNLPELAKVIRHWRKERGEVYPYFHTDACQAGRFLELNVARLGVDLLTINASKLYGPKGVGALYVKRGVQLLPTIYGGGQEAARRAGTENVPSIVGFATAVEICARERDKENKKIISLRDYFITKLLTLSGTSLNGPVGENRIAHNINISFADTEAEQVVIELDAKGVACSAGSACSIRSHDDSYVVKALGKSAVEAASAVRFTLGRDTAKSDLNYVLKILPPILVKLRKFAKI
jgi:cysteine desulfurase